MKISAYQANMKDECDNIARELVGQAIRPLRRRCYQRKPPSAWCRCPATNEGPHHRP